MAIDVDALKVALDTDPRYDAAVRSGNNRILLGLLKETEVGEAIRLVVPTVEVLDVVGTATLSPADVDKLLLYTRSETVDFRRDGIRTAIKGILNGNATELAALEALHTRTRTYEEAFGGEVELRDLWAALRQIPRSYLAKYNARG